MCAPAVAAYVALQVGPSAAAAPLPAVSVSYTGTMSVEVLATVHKPAHTVRRLGWSATASSGGADGSLALDFTSVAGTASDEGNGNCWDSTSTLGPATARNPVAAGWSLSETSNYPGAGWKYIASGVPALVPVLETQTGRCSSLRTEQLLQPNEMLLVQETLSPAQLEEYEALMEPLEFAPGKPASRTRRFAFDGTSHCTCLPDETPVVESMTVTVSVTSPASANDKKTEPRPGGSGSKSTSTSRSKSEARRKELKEQAREDLGPALEEAWKAHGLSAAIGLNYGVALSSVLDELGQSAALLAGGNATTRVIDDYRIIKDPPDRHYLKLARPRMPAPAKLRSCTAAPGPERATCGSLRSAETAMLDDGAKASALSAAMLVTMNRDSTAIKARAFGAAQRQYVHFESLRRSLKAALRKESSDGARLAVVLHGLGVSGMLSVGQSGTAIEAVEATLRKAGVSQSKLASLVPDALVAREVDALAFAR